MAERIELPPKYYLTYFQYLLRFVKDKYTPILNEAEFGFIHRFEALTEDAQCLFIRFSNRRGAFFRTQKLKYVEIASISESLQELLDNQFVEVISASYPSRIFEVLSVFNKAELLQLAKLLEQDTKGKNSLKKEEVMDWLMESTSVEQLVEAIQAIEVTENHPVGCIKVNFEQETMMLKFLFFGNRHAEMTEFVIRDLGIMRYQEFDEDKLVAQFASRQEAEDRLKVSLAKEDFYLMQEAEVEPIELYNWFLDWTEQHRPNLSEIALPSYERLTIRLATFLERQKLFDKALDIFRLTTEPPSRERQVRIFYKTKHNDEARALCEQILLDPQNAEEKFFAIDFLNRLEAEAQKKRVKKSVTAQLQRSDSIVLSTDWKYQVEAGTIHYMLEKGRMAIFAENHLWRCLFGLLFWDVIFDTEALAIHHPLQRSPSDLYKPQFWEKRRNRLVERLELLQQPADLQRHLDELFAEKMGVINPMVDWFEGLREVANVAFALLPPGALGKVMLEMAKNMRENTRGFPDLFTWSETDYEFIEVKSPTDNLSAQQLFWLHFFEEVGIKSKVLRIEWEQNLPGLVVSDERKG
ncbi:MAG: VRR-NUC domain-containing protein [Spirosomataceae bacterium]